VKTAAIGVLVAGLMIVASTILVIVSTGDTSTKATTNASSAVGRIYVGSITNESFRVAWVSVYGTFYKTGYIKWGPSPETWDSYIGTDLRASGSIDYTSPSMVHVAQTNFGSQERMNESATYWFKIIWNGIEYGDISESDTVYDYANCTDFGCIQGGRPWGITTCPAGLPAGHYNITGRVDGPPPLSMEPKNDVLVVVRVNDGSGDSLPIIDVTRYLDGSKGRYSIDVNMSRKATDGTLYAIAANATIKLFFDNCDTGWPNNQEGYPDWIYDTDQSINGSSPQEIHLHRMWYFTPYIPEMSGATFIASLIIVSGIVLVVSRRPKS